MPFAGPCIAKISCCHTPPTSSNKKQDKEQTHYKLLESVVGFKFSF